VEKGARELREREGQGEGRGGGGREITWIEESGEIAVRIYIRDRARKVLGAGGENGLEKFRASTRLVQIFLESSRAVRIGSFDWSTALKKGAKCPRKHRIG